MLQELGGDIRSSLCGSSGDIRQSSKQKCCCRQGSEMVFFLSSELHLCPIAVHAPFLKIASSLTVAVVQYSKKDLTPHTDPKTPT